MAMSFKILIALGSLFSLLMSMAALLFLLMTIFFPADQNGIIVTSLWERLTESWIVILFFLFFWGAAVAGIRYCCKN